MRIVFISHTAGSPYHGMLFRPYYFATQFQKMGHQCTIIAASFFHTRINNPVTKLNWTEELIDQVNYVWLKTLNYRTSGIKRALGFLIFAFKTLLYSPKISQRYKPDVVIATSPDPLVIFGAWSIAKMSKAKLVFEFRDIWPLTLTTIGKLSKWNPLVIAFKISEWFALSYSDYVVSPLSNAGQYLKDFGYKPLKFAIIPNGVDDSERSTKALDSSDLEIINQIKLIRSKFSFVLGYAGHHGVATNLEGVIEAISQLNNLSIALVLVGDGNEKPTLVKKAQELHLNNVYFFKPVHKSSIPSLLAHFDCCYLASPSSHLYKYGTSPNKLFDYMYANKPIISALANQDDVVEVANCGVKVKSHYSHDIANAIKSIYELSKSDRLLMGERGKIYVQENHNYRLLAEKYINFINS